MIVKNEQISFGQPTIYGRRLTVHEIVTGVYYDGLEDYLKDFELSIAQVKEGVVYCMNLACQEDKIGKFCNGCILSSLQDGVNFDINDFEVRLMNGEQYLIHKKTGSIFWGTAEEYKDELFGDVGWGIAREIFEKYFNDE